MKGSEVIYLKQDNDKTHENQFCNGSLINYYVFLDKVGVSSNKNKNEGY